MNVVIKEFQLNHELYSEGFNIVETLFYVFTLLGENATIFMVLLPTELSLSKHAN